MPKSYKKYDDHIKDMIIETGNPNAFPELNIPRTTAIYWIQKSKKRTKLAEVELDRALKEKILNLEKELQKERVKNIFLFEFLKNLHGVKELYNKERNKKYIVKTLVEYSKIISIEKLCKLVNIQSSKFYRLKIEFLGCKRIGFRKCKIQRPNQLSYQEQEVINSLVNDKSLNYLSIKALQYHAFRTRRLACGYDTWRKYTKIFNPMRVKTKKKRKKCQKGIHANYINQIWHMDITEFKLQNNQKAYLQVIVDNYSRKVIYWSLSRVKGEILSISTIKGALRKNRPHSMMTDGGGENIGLKLKRIYIGNNIRRVIAKQDIKKTNSMVESFFNVLKNKFINKYKYYLFPKLYNLIRRSILKYNSMPLPIFYGATPDEIFMNLKSIDDLKNDFSIQRQEALIRRLIENKECMRGKNC